MLEELKKELKTKTYSEKLMLLSDMRSKMHPLSIIPLTSIVEKVKKGQNLESHDEQWIDDMIGAIEEVK